MFNVVQSGIVGVPTGLDDLDERLGGLHKSDLVIVLCLLRSQNSEVRFGKNVTDQLSSFRLPKTITWPRW